MVVFLYRWLIKPGFEDQFVESWSAITAYYRKQDGSLGSRLHRGTDGVWYAYAQWQSPGQRQAAFAEIPEMPERDMLKAAIEEFLDETELEITVDFLVDRLDPR